MFDAKRGEDGSVILYGRFDASQVEKARAVFDSVTESCTVNFENLDYISSAGLGLLLGTQKRLNESDHKLILVNLNKHIKDIFLIAGFDFIFEIE